MVGSVHFSHPFNVAIRQPDPPCLVECGGGDQGAAFGQRHRSTRDWGDLDGENPQMPTRVKRTFGSFLDILETRWT